MRVAKSIGTFDKAINKLHAGFFLHDDFFVSYAKRGRR
jgi:hypothetical protein